METIRRSGKDRRQSKADIHISRSVAIVKSLRKGIILHHTTLRSNHAKDVRIAASRRGSRRSSILRRKLPPTVPASGAKPGQVHVIGEAGGKVVADVHTNIKATSTNSCKVPFVPHFDDQQLVDADDESPLTQPYSHTAEQSLTGQPITILDTVSAGECSHGGTSKGNTSVNTTHTATTDTAHTNEMRRNSVILGQISVQQNEVAVIPRLDAKNDRNIVAWVSQIIYILIYTNACLVVAFVHIRLCILVICLYNTQITIAVHTLSHTALLYAHTNT